MFAHLYIDNGPTCLLEVDKDNKYGSNEMQHDIKFTPTDVPLCYINFTSKPRIICAKT